jgi:hypothetical protein
MARPDHHLPSFSLSKFTAPKFTVPKFTALGLGLVLLVTGGAWVAQVVWAPPAAQAYRSRLDVSLDRLRDETYQSFIRRAEIIARAAAQRSFDRDILTSEVSIMVIGRHNGTETPVLLLDVSREKWRERPDTRRWATYYRTAQTLLKLPSAGPAPIPNAAPAQPQLIPSIEQITPPPSAPITVPPPAPGEAIPVTPQVAPAAPPRPANAPSPAPTPTASPAVSPSPAASPSPSPSPTPTVSPRP